jgi:hypothetical protein
MAPASVVDPFGNILGILFTNSTCWANAGKLDKRAYQKRIHASRGTRNIEALPLPGSASGALCAVEAIVTNSFVSASS